MALLRELVVGDSPEVWAALGFTVEGDRCRVGHVDIVFDPSVGKGIRKWSLVGASDGDRPDEVDGVPTTWMDDGVDEAPAHPNGVFEIDHVVVSSPDIPRTISNLAKVGVPALRERETGTYGAPMVQVFFRLGQPILELIGPKEPQGDKPARFFGLAFTSQDLELTSKVIGDALHRSKDAVQAGRQIATLDKSAGSTIGFAIMSPHTKDEDVV